MVNQQNVDKSNENTGECDHQWKLLETRFEYAWRYFDFHSKQRTTMFNFFAVFSGFLIAACVELLNGHPPLILTLLSLLGIAITILFLFLERRNEELVHIAEEVLRKLENDTLFRDFKGDIDWPKQRSLCGEMEAEEKESVPIGIFVRQDYDVENQKESKYSHGRWMPWVHYAIAFCYISFAIYSICLLLK